jgi:hypothetical protein
MSGAGDARVLTRLVRGVTPDATNGRMLTRLGACT